MLLNVSYIYLIMPKIKSSFITYFSVFVLVLVTISFAYDTKPPTVNVIGVPKNILIADEINATITCSDADSGCEASSYRFFVSLKKIDECPKEYEKYDRLSPSTFYKHSWVCGAAKDEANNTGFSPVFELKIFNRIQDAVRIAKPDDTITVYVDNKEVVLSIGKEGIKYIAPTSMIIITEEALTIVGIAVCLIILFFIGLKFLEKRENQKMTSSLNNSSGQI